MSVRRQRAFVFGVVSLTRGTALLAKCRVEILRRAVLTSTGGNQPRVDDVMLVPHEYCATPAAYLGFEQDGVINGTDALMGSVSIRKLFG